MAARLSDRAVAARLPVTPVIPTSAAVVPAPSTVVQRRAVVPASTRSVMIAAAMSTFVMLTPTADTVPAPAPAKPPRFTPPIVSTSDINSTPSASLIICEKPLMAKFPLARRNPPAMISPSVTSTPNVWDLSDPNT